MYTEEKNEYGFLRSHLTAGEAILWKGKPGKGHLLTGQDVFMIPFSILWCGFAFFWEYSVLSQGITPFALFGIPFVLMGIYMVVGRFFWTAWIRRRTLYAVTSRKIIRKRGSRVDMLDIRTLPPMHMASYADGSGTILFNRSPYYRMNYNDLGLNAQFSLEVIPQVSRVHQIISEAMR